MRSSVVLTLGAVTLVACAKPQGLKLNEGATTTVEKAKEDFECRPAGPERRYFCSRDKTLLGQESTILGTVYKVEPNKPGECPAPLAADEVREAVLPGLNKSTLTLTNAITTQIDFALVRRDVTANVKALTFLDSSMAGDTVASVDLQRTTRAIVEDDRLNAQLEGFAAKHPGACRLYVTTGYAADVITARVFTSSKAKAGGGVYGVNVDGTYFASDETVKRDYQWALSVVRIDLGQSKRGGMGSENKGVDTEAAPAFTIEAPATSANPAKEMPALDVKAALP